MKRTAIVTGARGGIGEATARKFMELGGRVHGADLAQRISSGFVAKPRSEGLGNRLSTAIVRVADSYQTPESFPLTLES